MLLRIKKIAREYLCNKPDLKLVSINSAWLIGDKIVRLFLGLFVSVWIARYLGPEQYGKLAYAIAFIAIFQAISTLGLDTIIVREIARDTNTSNQILGTSIILRLVSSLVSFFSAWLIISIISPDDFEIYILVVLIGLGVIFQTSDIIDLWFQSQSQSRRTIIAKFVSYVIATVFKFFLVITSASLWLFSIAIAGEVALSAIALYISYRKHSTTKKWTWNMFLAKKMLSQSWPLLLSGISVVLFMRSSQLMMNELMDAASVGIYSSAQLLSELWYFLPMTLVLSFAPIIARKKRDSEASYISSLEKIFSLMWLISITISITIIFSSELIITILFGDSFNAASSILSIHILTLIPVCIGVTQSLWLINENKTHIALYQALAGVISAIGLNFLLISKYGMIGGAIAIVTSQFIQVFIISALLAPTLFILQIRSLIALKSYPVKIAHLVISSKN